MHMTLYEFNNYISEYSYAKNTNSVAHAWKIVNFVGLLIGGKLKDLKNYLPKRKDDNKVKNDNNLSLRERKVIEAQEQAKLLGHNF